jgi:SAM-dependent methyltransferase
MNDHQSLARRLKTQYDSGMYVPLVQEYFGFSGFHNYGYWCPRTGSQREASENLVDVLDSLGNILCVEAAFHFDTREEFLREAYRVLKPGGCLALYYRCGFTAQLRTVAFDAWSRDQLFNDYLLVSALKPVAMRRRRCRPVAKAP